jgi:hypothetical protein
MTARRTPSVRAGVETRLDDLVHSARKHGEGDGKCSVVGHDADDSARDQASLVAIEPSTMLGARGHDNPILIMPRKTLAIAFI